MLCLGITFEVNTSSKALETEELASPVETSESVRGRPLKTDWLPTPAPVTSSPLSSADVRDSVCCLPSMLEGAGITTI